jgi:hypothetical protein
MSKINNTFYLNPKLTLSLNHDTLDDCLTWFGCPESIESLGLEISCGDGLFLQDLVDDAFSKSGYDIDNDYSSPEWDLVSKYEGECDFNLIRRKSDNALLTDVKLSFIYDDDIGYETNVKITGKKYVPI